MKNYEQVTNDLLERRNKYVARQRKKKKKMIGIAGSLCCVCLVALMSVGVWRGGWFKSISPVTLDDSTIIGEKDYISPDELNDNANKNQNNQTPSNGVSDIGSSPIVDNDLSDMIGVIKMNGITYIQYHTDENLFTADACLGDANHYEGSYKNFPGIDNPSAILYTTKESQNVILVKLGNGATVVLGRAGEIDVNGKAYFPSQLNPNQITQDMYLGKAEKFEIISVPHRDTTIHSTDEIWTVKNDDSKLLIKKSDGSVIVFCAYND